MLHSEGLGGVLINAQHNFAWLTGGRSNGIDLSRDNGAAWLLVRRDGKRFLIANNIELHRMVAEELATRDFEPLEVSWQDEKASPDAVIRLAGSVLPHGAELAADIFPSNKLRPVESSIAQCRYQLTQPEIERFRSLGGDAGKALGRAASRITPGNSEIEIANAVRSELSHRGIYAVVTLVGADDRIEQYRHPVPTANIWNKNLLVAVCARREGLIVSLTRIVCAGEISPELHRRTEAAAAVNAALYSATIEGAKASGLYKIAADAYAAQGFAGEIDKHHQGGACGYRTRDWVAHPANDEFARLHQGFAWNPSITGTKTEETGVVTADGFEVVTATDGFPIISTVIEGREYFSPGILSLSKGASA